MNKTLTVNIAGTVFTIEEDAYQALKIYLDSVKVRFTSYTDNAEILADIEARVAEQFLQNAPATKIITIKEVEQLISTMGRVEDIDKELEDGEASQTKPQEESQIKRRLFRDPDNKILAGVAAGLSMYFDIDPIVVRLIFVLSTIFLGGTGLIVYVILLICMPEAKTPTDKLQMRGGPIDLQSLRQSVVERVESLRNSEKARSSIRSFFEKIFEAFGILVRAVLSLTGKLFGIGLSLGATFGILVLSFILLNILFNAQSPYVDFPLASVAHGISFNALVGLSYVVLVVPLILIFLGANALLTKRKLLTMPVGVTLASIWVLALLGAGVLMVRLAPEYADHLSRLPEYQTITRSEPVSQFNKLEVSGAERVIVARGATTTAMVRGSQATVDRVDMKVVDGTLQVHSRPSESKKICLFCGSHGRATITITVPSLTGVKTDGAADVVMENVQLESISLETRGVSSITLEGKIGTMLVDADGSSQVELQGTAKKMTIEATGTSYINSSMLADTADVKTQGAARVWVWVAKELSVVAGGVSRVTYGGTPHITKTIAPTARLYLRNNVDGYDFEEVDVNNSELPPTPLSVPTSTIAP